MWSLLQEQFLEIHGSVLYKNNKNESDLIIDDIEIIELK